MNKNPIPLAANENQQRTWNFTAVCNTKFNWPTAVCNTKSVKNA